MKTFPALICSMIVWSLLYLGLGWSYNEINQDAAVCDIFADNYGWWIVFFVLLFLGFKFVYIKKIS